MLKILFPKMEILRVKTELLKVPGQRNHVNKNHNLKSSFKQISLINNFFGSLSFHILRLYHPKKRWKNYNSFTR